MNCLHDPRPIRDICRSVRFCGANPVALDDANDAWLDDAGRVSERNSRFHYIGDVSHLRGAARVAAARALLVAYRTREMTGGDVAGHIAASKGRVIAIEARTASCGGA